MKVKYDKKLNKFHIQFNNKNSEKEKKDIYNKLGKNYDISFSFDTEIDGKKTEEREQSVEALIAMLKELDLDYEMTHREVERTKRLFGIPTMTKIRDTHYTISATIKKNDLNDELIDFFINHEMKITFKGEDNKEESFYDSTIFNKFFSTCDLSKL